MSLQPPANDWQIKPLGKDEKVWMYIIILMILMMGTMTLGWVFVGNQNVPEEYHHYDSAADLRAAFISGNTDPQITLVTLSNGEPAFARLAAGDIYLVASQWQWEARNSNDDHALSIQFKEGVRYQLHLGSTDVLHGFELIGGDFIITLQVVPLYDYVLDFTPTQTGLFRIICNEYCGYGHQGMTSFFEVIA